MPVIKGVVKGLTEQTAPAGCGRLDSEAEKAQAAFGKNGTGDAEGEADENRARDIGQQMAEHNIKGGNPRNFTAAGI